MHLRDPSTARVLRRASTGPHALMSRGALPAFVPGRGQRGLHGVPFRMAARFGAANPYATAVSSAYTGASVGAAVGSTLLATGGTTVASTIGAAAAAGSFVPIIGTAIGLIVGLVASGVFNHRVDPEVGNFNAAIQLYNAQGLNGIINIADKYLVLAGLFDLEPGQIKGNIPIYKKYGRMGEQRFTQDMANVIYNAAQAGQIGPNDTIETVFSRIVQPWIDSFGYGAMSDSNMGMIQAILLGMTAEYITGLWKQRWFARAGDMPNWQIQPFTLPNVPAALQASQASQVPTASPTPSPVVIPTYVPPPDPVAQELARYKAGWVPNPGDVIHLAWDQDQGQFLAVPPATQFYGRDPQTGSWIVTHNNAQYILQNGSLNPYSVPVSVTPGTPSAPVTLPAAVPLTSSAPSNSTSASALTPPSSSPVIPVYASGGGGYMPLPAPLPVMSPGTSVSGGPSMQEILLMGGGVLALLLILKRQRSA